MAISQICLSVRWPDDRNVTVTVDVYRVHRGMGPMEEGERGERIVAIDDDQLEDERVLRAFLADLTRREPNAASVEAVILEPDVDRFLTLLGVADGPLLDPVIVDLGDDG